MEHRSLVSRLAGLPVGERFTFHIEGGRHCSGIVVRVSDEFIEVEERGGGVRTIRSSTVTDFAPLLVAKTPLPRRARKGGPWIEPRPNWLSTARDRLKGFW